MAVTPAVGALRVRCPAKINLGLWILGRRPDGYHEIDTILQAVAHEDELLVTPGPPGLELATRGLRIPGPGPNIVERAWALLEGEGLLPAGAGVRVRLTKRIPAGAGLGGGSSDAAGFLAAMNRFFALRLDDSALERLCGLLGSDVTFLLKGGTARATGRGDRVRHLCPISPAWVVLATPPVAISTTWAYEQARNRLTHEGSSATLLSAAIARDDLDGVVAAMRNDFEDVILPRYPEIQTLKRLLQSNGAAGAQLSGSGSTIFGIAKTRAEASRAARSVDRGVAAVRVIRTLERGITVAQVC
jgi:4-diphosphocytidyl-2-C-methyl-D-erythritol kinase